MKTFFSILAVALAATVATQAQERAKEKPAAKEQTAETSQPKNKETKPAKEDRMKGFDNNFRAQERKTADGIYLLGGRLTQPGKKPGEGC